MRKKWKNKTHEVINGKTVMTKSYSTWHHMLQRCYNDKFHKVQPTYIGCTVCKEWHDYDVFFAWFAQNYIEGYHLDKDLIQQGNKVYSPSTCVFLTQRINSLLIESNKSRGECPIGVCFNKQKKKFQARCSNGSGKNVHLGYYTNPTDAHNAYKTYKYALIKDIAEEALTNKEISQQIFQALLAWKIEYDR